MGSSRHRIERKPPCAQTDVTNTKVDVLQYQREDSSSSFESRVISLSKFVLPPVRVKHLEIGNLYIRKRKDRKEFVRKIYGSPYKLIVKMSLSREQIAAAKATLDHRISQLRRELQYRDDQERGSRSGHRVPRPYHYSSVNLNLSTAPILEDRHPEDYRRRRRSSVSSLASSAVSIASVEVDFHRHIHVDERRDGRRSKPDSAVSGACRRNLSPRRPSQPFHRPSTPHNGPPVVPRRPEPARGEPSRWSGEAIMQRCCCGRFWYLCRNECCSRHRRGQRHLPPVIIRPEPNSGRTRRGSHEDDGLYHIQDRSPSDYM